MAERTSLGRVGLVLRGEYSPSTPYLWLDVVYFEKGAYVCKRDNIGQPVTDTRYWQPIVTLDDVAGDMDSAIQGAQQAAQAATDAAGTAYTAAERAVSIAQEAGTEAVTRADNAGNEARRTAQTAASAANTAADNATSAANALQAISFDINADSELEVNIPWQS